MCYLIYLGIIYVSGVYAFSIFDTYNNIIINNTLVTNIMQGDTVCRFSSFLTQKTTIPKKNKKFIMLISALF